jgi:uncharacterized membrane protein YeaQ/YmgE (transglycosylase-associated protein family)
MPAIVWTILIGFVVGVVAKFIIPGKVGGGFILTTVLGIAGSFVGNWLFGMLGFGGAGFIGAVIGAMLLIWVARMLNK